MNSHTLDSIVRDYLIEKGDSSMYSYARCLQIAISGVREMSMDVNGVVKHVELPVLANGTVNMPEDFMDVIKVAVHVNGSLHELSSTKNITPILPKDDCGNDLPAQGSEGSYLLHNYSEPHTRNGEVTGRYYGIGGGRNRFGNYRLDPDNGRILLNLSDFSITSIIMEYICDPSLVDGELLVHPYQVEAVKAWIWWKDIQKKRNVPMGEKEMARVDYKRCKMMAKRRHKSFTLQDALETLRRHVKGSPRL